MRDKQRQIQSAEERCENNQVGNKQRREEQPKGRKTSRHRKERKQQGAISNKIRK